VLSLSGRLTVPFGSFGRLLVSRAARWSPRPSLKYYASGVGEIAEVEAGADSGRTRLNGWGGPFAMGQIGLRVSAAGREWRRSGTPSCGN
jgi:hypothetical protein